MNKFRKSIATLGLLSTLTLAACGATTIDGTAATSTTTTSQSASAVSEGVPAEGPGGGPGGIDPTSVTTENELVALIQDAYGDGGLGLHRGHQPVEDVLNEVLGISHDELHVRMDAGQNLATIAEEVGVGQDALVEALVESWSPAIDTLLESGAISDDEAEQYREALEKAFTFRVTWDGSTETQTFNGLTA
jgi:DNA-binding phage protein